MPKTSASSDFGSMTERCLTGGPRVRRSFFLLCLALVASGCEVPQFRGPQVQAPPVGFIKKSDVLQHGPRMFPDRPTVHFDAWIETEWGEFTGIYINGHAGTTTLEDVVAARVRSMEHPPDHPMAYGDIETIHVDGRTGWAWMEIWRDNGLHEIQYHAAIPYDTVTYTVDFTTGDPRFKARPDSIRAIVGSFAIGRVEWNWMLIAISTVFGAILLRSGWSKLVRRPYESMRHLPLAQFPVVDAEGADEDAAAGEQTRSPSEPHVSDGTV